MIIEMLYDGLVVEQDNNGGPDMTKVRRTLHKRYECDILDRDMIESPKGKELDRFVIEDLQLTQKRDVDLVIEMMQNVKKALKR